MKYIGIYKQSLKEQKSRLRRRELSKKGTLEAIFIEIALRYPKKTFGEMREIIKDEFNISVSINEVEEVAQNLNLKSFELRNELRNEIRELSAALKLALEGNIKNIKHFIELIEEVAKRRLEGRIKFVFKSLGVYLLAIDKNKSDSDRDFLARAQECDFLKLFRSVARRILNTSEKEYEKFLQQLNVDEESIDALRFQVASYRDTLGILESKIMCLQAELDATNENSEKEVTCTFFKKLNSSEYGSVLDSIVIVSKKIKEMRKAGIKIPVELNSLPIIVKQLEKFIRACRVTEIEVIGSTLNVRCEDIAFVNYTGEPFIEENEEKKVKVIKSGWKLDDEVITEPTVREI